MKDIKEVMELDFYKIEKADLKDISTAGLELLRARLVWESPDKPLLVYSDIQDEYLRRSKNYDEGVK